MYLGDSGQVYFVVKPEAVKVLTSPPATTTARGTNGRTSERQGMYLYLDGVQVGSDTAKTFNAQVNTGYWRVGGDATSGWSGAGTSPYLAGNIDNPAVYPVALTASQVSAHYAARTG